MASEGAVAKRAKLLTSRVHWCNKELSPTAAQVKEAQRVSNQDNVREWLTTTVAEEDAKHVPLSEAAESLSRSSSSDDDLALGVEASLYGKQGVKTVRNFLRWKGSYPDLNRLSSFNSATSGHARPLSVMDIIKLWNDDPEEVLLDLGFGCNEPDLSGRIPARFINHQSQARGINLQVFLEAQQKRLDLETPDVSNRFRQLEVLHEVTSAFSSLKGASSSPLRRPLSGKDLPAGAHERRKRMGMLLRRASKKSLSQSQNNNFQNKTTRASPATESVPPPPGLRNKTAPVKRVKPGFQESCLSPLVEEKGDFPDIQPQVASFVTQEAAFRPGQLKDSDTRTTHGILLKNNCSSQARESFEMEEIHSFDEGSVTGNVMGGAENSVRGVVRTSSCQSDSSGFLEEPFIPSIPQQASLGPDLIKALCGSSEESTDSQFNERPASSSPPCTSLLPPIGSPVTLLTNEKLLLPSPCPSSEPSLISPASSPNSISDKYCSDATVPPDQEAHNFLPYISASVRECVSPALSSPKLEITNELEHLVVPPVTSLSALPATSCLIKPTALTGGSEDMQTENKEAPLPYSHDSEVPAHSILPDVPPVTSSFSPPRSFYPSCFATISVDFTQADSLWRSGGTQSESAKKASKEEALSTRGEVQSPDHSSHSLPPTDAHCPPSYASAAMSLKTVEDLLQNIDKSCEETSPTNLDVIAISDSNRGKRTEEEATPSPLSLKEGNLSTPLSCFPHPSKLEKDCTVPHLSYDTPDSICQTTLSSFSYDPGDFIGPDVGILSEMTDQNFSRPDGSSHSDDNKNITSVAPIQYTTHIQKLSSLGSDDTLHKTGKGEGESHANTMQTHESLFNTSSVKVLTGASELDSEEVYCETEAELQVCSSSSHDDLEFNHPDLDARALSDPKQGKQIEEEATPSLLSSNKKDTSPPLSFFPDSSKSEESATVPYLSSNPPVPVCESTMLSFACGTSDFMDPAVGRMSELAEQHLFYQDRPFHYDENTDINSVTPIQNITSVQMDHSSLGSENTLQKTGKGERERLTNMVQTHEPLNNISNTKCCTVLTEGSDIASEEECYAADEDLNICSYSIHDDFSPETNQEIFGDVGLEVDASESETPKSHFVIFDGVPEAHSRTQQQLKVAELIELESLDSMFETSVDGSEFDGEDVDAIFQELDTEGLVYWAEPIQISNPTPVLEEPASFEASEGSPENYSFPANSALLKGPTTFSSSSSISQVPSVNADVPLTQNDSSDTPNSLDLPEFLSNSLTQEHGLSLRSVSVQMSTCPSSHIVQRKDIPYTSDSKPTIIPTVVPLDTSTPFRAVQSWTDQRIQRNTVNNKLSHESKNNFSNGVTSLTGAPEMAKGPTVIISSTPSFALLSNDCQSHDSLPGLGRNSSTLTESVDTGLWPDEVEEVDRIYKEDGLKHRNSNQVTTMPCCCSCGDQCSSCTQDRFTKQHSLPYSLDELEQMMICLQRFRSVLNNMEEQLSDDQASVYSVLSDHDREKVRDIEELRGEVKREAGELEVHLEELVHHCDESLKMKMHRLLDEQSLLCSQLRVFPPADVENSASPAPHRSVATQCCLPWFMPADTSWGSWNPGSSRHSPPGPNSICECLGCSPTKTDKLDIVGFLQRVRTSDVICGKAAETEKSAASQPTLKGKNL